MYLRTYYPTVVLSDIHLGTQHSKTEEVTRFLKSINCDRLILNGDIIEAYGFLQSDNEDDGKFRYAGYLCPW